MSVNPSQERSILATSVHPVLPYVYHTSSSTAYIPYCVPPKGHTRHTYAPTSMARMLPHPSQLICTRS
jgi:hypothetical protein